MNHSRLKCYAVDYNASQQTTVNRSGLQYASQWTKMQRSGLLNITVDYKTSQQTTKYHS